MRGITLSHISVATNGVTGRQRHYTGAC